MNTWKRGIALLLCLLLCLGALPGTAWGEEAEIDSRCEEDLNPDGSNRLPTDGDEIQAQNTYVINGVSVTHKSSSISNNCWTYAQEIYKKIWNKAFTNDRTTSDNYLRNITSSSELELTTDHLRNYVSAAAVGSVIRTTSSSYLFEKADSVGHSQLIVQKDGNGFTVFESNINLGNGVTGSREKYYTWSEYISKWYNNNHKYIKYIKNPNATPYSPSPYLNINITHAPSGTLDYGKGYSLEGTISSSTPLSKVYGYVGTVEGQPLAGFQYTKTYAQSDNVYSYNIKTGGLDSAIKFGQLSPGNYVYQVTAANYGGMQAKSQCYSFSVGQDPNTGYLDLNGWLDGADSPNLSNYGTFDITIGGETYKDQTDFYKAYPYGTTYSITNIQSKGMHTYHGVHIGNLSGTIGSSYTEVMLNFRTNDDVGSLYFAYIKAKDGQSVLYNQDDNNVVGHAPVKAVDAIWYFKCIDSTNNIYQISSAKDWRSLDIQGNGTSAGANVITHPYHGESNQQWVIHEENGYVLIGAKSTTCVLDAGGAVNGATANAYMNDELLNNWQWLKIEKVNQYTVSYNANGGSGTPDSQNKYQDVALTLSGTKPTRSGYTFLGWATSSDATSAQYAAGAQYTANASVTLYAVWQANPVSVTGVTLDKTSLTLHHNGSGQTSEKLIATVIPSNATNQSVVWSSSNSNIAKVDSSGNVTAVSGGTATITATTSDGGYKANCTVTIPAVLDINGYFNGEERSNISGFGTFDLYFNGSQEVDDDTDYYHEWPNGTKYEIKDVRPATGYVFVGARTSNSPMTGTFGTSDIKVVLEFAKAKTYTITYNANGGTGAPAAQTKTQGVPLTLSSTVPTRSGYTFLGWAESQSATAAQYQPSGSFTKDANTTLYAVWKSNVVSVTGVTLNKTSLTLNKGASESLTATVSPSNATNKSVTWSSSNTSVATVDSNGKVTAVSAGSTTVTVKTNDGGKTATCAVTVKPNTYAITYDANGGTGAPPAQYKTQDVPLTLSSTVPTRSGYTFLGWAESKTATTAQYQPGGSFTKNANTTLYAVWKSAPTGREEDGILTVESVRARPGAEVSVGVSFTNNPGVMVMALGLDYDRSVLTLTGFEDGGFTGWSVNTSAIWLGDSDSTFNGTILKLKFRVADNAPEGDILVTLRYSEGDIANQNETPLLPKCNPGKVTVSNNLPGDITGDGKVNAMDLLRLKKYLAGDSVTLVGSGDITGDGKINAMDLLRLKKYLAGDAVVIHRAGEPDAILMASGQEASLSVSTASGGPGDTVTLDISIANNPGIMVLNPKLSFNTDVLEYVGYEDAGLTGWAVTERGMVWIGDGNSSFNGVILKLKLKVKDSATSGLAEVTLLCEDGDAANENEEIVSLSVTGGGVIVEGGTDIHTHTMTHVPAADPTCTEPGNIEYWYCAECGKYFSDANAENEIAQKDTVIPPKGHTPGEAVRENEVPATCTEPGSYDAVVYCTVCDAELSRETVSVPALGHDWGEWTETKAPSCTEPGEETRTCKRDGTHKETREIPPTGHTPGEAVHENEVPATCTEPGSYDAVVCCTVCGAELSRETVPVPALGHDWGDWTQTKAPTETEEGEETRSCKRCDATETRTIPPLVHQCEYTHVPAVEPSCTEPGNIEHWRCPICGKYYVGDKYDLHLATEDEVLLPALGHDWGDWTETQAPSCTEAGEEARTCKRDETHKETREIPPTGHTPGEAVHENEVPATCTEAGSYDEVVYCTACGAELSRDSKTVPALGHDWSDWTATTEATCTEAGEESRSCKRCDETETRATSPLGHDWGAWTVTKEPTETEPGEESRVCARCGETETRVMTEPEDHDWGDWKLTTKPGCTRSGQETRVCAHCGETETRPVEALGHRWGEWAVTKQPTATETGTETIRCLRCGRTMTRTVPSLTMPFTDVPEDAWYYEAVHKVWAQGLMTGVSDTLFAPGQSCERGMIVTILYRLAGAPEAGTSGFLDVPEGDYYAAAVAWAEAEGIVYGYDETHFFPRTPITRQQLAAMLYRYAAWAGLDVSAADGLTDYADAETVSGYALEAMRWAVAQELLFGTEAQRLEPDAEATRAQTAAALARFTELAD